LRFPVVSRFSANIQLHRRPSAVFLSVVLISLSC